MGEIKTLVGSLKLEKEDFADFRITEVESTSLVVRKGNVEQVMHDISIGGAARVLVNGSWGFYYTTDLSSEGIRLALEKAYKAAKALSENVIEKSEVKIERTYEDEVKLNVKIDPRSISLEEKANSPVCRLYANTYVISSLLSSSDSGSLPNFSANCFLISLPCLTSKIRSFPCLSLNPLTHTAVFSLLTFFTAIPVLGNTLSVHT